MAAATRCFFVSRYVLEAGVRLGAPTDRSEVFYLGVPLPDHTATAANQGPLRLVANSRLAPIKGHRFLLHAFRRVVNAGVDAQLALIGEGPLKTELQTLCKNLGIAGQVEFAGALPNQRVYQVLARSHLFVHTAQVTPRGEQEGLGLAVQEAMAVGLPVIATSSGGVPESVVDGETGLLAPADDDEAFAATIVSLARDPAGRARMGQAGRARTERLFDVRRQNRILVERLREIAAVA